MTSTAASLSPPAHNQEKEEEEWFKRFCADRVRKIAMFIYAKSLSTVSPARQNRFYDRLIKSVAGLHTDQEREDSFYATEERILQEHKFFTYSMWKFCGTAVMRLCHQIGSRGGGVKFNEFGVLKRRLFRSVRRARDDADVNARIAAFYKKVRREYSSKKT